MMEMNLMVSEERLGVGPGVGPGSVVVAQCVEVGREWVMGFKNGSGGRSKNGSRSGSRSGSEGGSGTAGSGSRRESHRRESCGSGSQVVVPWAVSPTGVGPGVGLDGGSRSGSGSKGGSKSWVPVSVPMVVGEAGWL
jgi:hypothetical protein